MMNDQSSPDCQELLDIDRTEEQKKVRFSNSIAVYDFKSWKDKSEIIDHELGNLPIKSSLKLEGMAYTAKDEGGELSFCGILLLICVLIVLFILIGWIVHRLLLIEIESQVSDQTDLSISKRIRALFKVY